jgi:hypothetical protein
MNDRLLEIERLTSEVQRLTAENAEMLEVLSLAQRDVIDLKAENIALRALTQSRSTTG